MYSGEKKCVYIGKKNNQGKKFGKIYLEKSVRHRENSIHLKKNKMLSFYKNVVVRKRN